MALTHNRAKELCDVAAELSNRLKKFLHDAEKFLDTNSDLSIDWANAQKPAFLNEDVAGNLDGVKFTRAQMANAIGSIYQVKQLLRGQTPDTGDHLGNLNQLADIAP